MTNTNAHRSPGGHRNELVAPPDQDSSLGRPLSLAPNHYFVFISQLAIEKQTTANDFFGTWSLRGRKSQDFQCWNVLAWWGETQGGSGGRGKVPGTHQLGQQCPSLDTKSQDPHPQMGIGMPVSKSCDEVSMRQFTSSDYPSPAHRKAQ